MAGDVAAREQVELLTPAVRQDKITDVTVDTRVRVARWVRRPRSRTSINIDQELRQAVRRR